jgi:type II secretory pathway pseudopilin PulG
MLVVIAIIGILLAVVFRGGSALLRSSKARDTEALLAKLNLALDEYRREVDHSRIPNSMALFNKFPPDDLRVFVGASGASLPIVGGCEISMRNTGAFVLDGGSASLGDLLDPRGSDGSLQRPDQLLHADIRAMVLSMRLFSPKASKILDSIDPVYWQETDQRLIYNPRPVGQQCPADPTRCAGRCLGQSTGVFLDLYLQSESSDRPARADLERLRAREQRRGDPGFLWCGRRRPTQRRHLQHRRGYDVGGGFLR